MDIMRSTFRIVIALLTFVFANVEGATRVYVDIVGDLFHAGHVEFFKKARSFGDHLIVGVLADDIVEGYKRQPVISLQDRVKVIEACRYVDEVVVGPPPHLTSEMIEEMDIQYIVHGDDINLDLLHEHYGTAVKLDIFKLVPYTEGISTTEIIGRIVERTAQGDFQ